MSSRVVQNVHEPGESDCIHNTLLTIHKQCVIRVVPFIPFITCIMYQDGLILFGGFKITHVTQI